MKSGKDKTIQKIYFDDDSGELWEDNKISQIERHRTDGIKCMLMKRRKKSNSQESFEKFSCEFVFSSRNTYGAVSSLKGSIFVLYFQLNKYVKIATINNKVEKMCFSGNEKNEDLVISFGKNLKVFRNLQKSDTISLFGHLAPVHSIQNSFLSKCQAILMTCSMDRLIIWHVSTWSIFRFIEINQINNKALNSNCFIQSFIYSFTSPSLSICENKTDQVKQKENNNCFLICLDARQNLYIYNSTFELVDKVDLLHLCTELGGTCKTHFSKICMIESYILAGGSINRKDLKGSVLYVYNIKKKKTKFVYTESRFINIQASTNLNVKNKHIYSDVCYALMENGVLEIFDLNRMQRIIQIEKDEGISCINFSLNFFDYNLYCLMSNGVCIIRDITTTIYYKNKYFLKKIEEGMNPLLAFPFIKTFKLPNKRNYNSRKENKNYNNEAYESNNRCVNFNVINVDDKNYEINRENIDNNNNNNNNVNYEAIIPKSEKRTFISSSNSCFSSSAFSFSSTSSMRTPNHSENFLESMSPFKQLSSVKSVHSQLSSPLFSNMTSLSSSNKIDFSCNSFISSSSNPSCASSCAPFYSRRSSSECSSSSFSPSSSPSSSFSSSSSSSCFFFRNKFGKLNRSCKDVIVGKECHDRKMISNTSSAQSQNITNNYDLNQNVLLEGKRCRSVNRTEKTADVSCFSSPLVSSESISEKSQSSKANRVKAKEDSKILYKKKKNFPYIHCRSSSQPHSVGRSPLCEKIIKSKKFTAEAGHKRFYTNFAEPTKDSETEITEMNFIEEKRNKSFLNTQKQSFSEANTSSNDNLSLNFWMSRNKDKLKSCHNNNETSYINDTSYNQLKSEGGFCTYSDIHLDEEHFMGSDLVGLKTNNNVKNFNDLKLSTLNGKEKSYSDESCPVDDSLNLENTRNRKKKDKMKCSKSHKENLYSSFNVSSDKKKINTETLRSYLLHEKQFPMKYRPLIYKYFLQLPLNKNAFMNLEKKGVHQAYSNLYNVYPIQSRTMFKRFQKILSCLTHWCSFLQDVHFLPLLVFPFVQLYARDSLFCFELIMCILLNWCKDWFYLYPNPPIYILSAISECICKIDCSLYKHILELSKKNRLTFLWEPLYTLLSDVLGSSEWLILLDNLIANFRNPKLLYAAVAAFFLCNKTLIMSMRDSETFYAFLSTQNTVDMSLFVAVMHSICNCENEEESISKIQEILRKSSINDVLPSSDNCGILSNVAHDDLNIKSSNSYNLISSAALSSFFPPSTSSAIPLPIGSYPFFSIAPHFICNSRNAELRKIEEYLKQGGDSETLDVLENFSYRIANQAKEFRLWKQDFNEMHEIRRREEAKEEERMMKESIEMMNARNAFRLKNIKALADEFIALMHNSRLQMQKAIERDKEENSRRREMRKLEMIQSVKEDKLKELEIRSAMQLQHALIEIEREENERHLKQFSKHRIETMKKQEEVIMKKLRCADDERSIRLAMKRQNKIKSIMKSQDLHRRLELEENLKIEEIERQNVLLQKQREWILRFAIDEENAIAQDREELLSKQAERINKNRIRAIEAQVDEVQSKIENNLDAEKKELQNKIKKERLEMLIKEEALKQREILSNNGKFDEIINENLNISEEATKQFYVALNTLFNNFEKKKEESYKELEKRVMNNNSDVAMNSDHQYNMEQDKSRNSSCEDVTLEFESLNRKSTNTEENTLDKNDQVANNVCGYEDFDEYDKISVNKSDCRKIAESRSSGDTYFNYQLNGNSVNDNEVLKDCFTSMKDESDKQEYEMHVADFRRMLDEWELHWRLSKKMKERSEEKSGEEKSCEEKSGEEKSCEEKSCEEKSCEEKSCEEKNGENEKEREVCISLFCNSEENSNKSNEIHAYGEEMISNECCSNSNDDRSKNTTVYGYGQLKNYGCHNHRKTSNVNSNLPYSSNEHNDYVHNNNCVDDETFYAELSHQPNNKDASNLFSRASFFSKREKEKNYNKLDSNEKHYFFFGDRDTVDERFQINSSSSEEREINEERNILKECNNLKKFSCQHEKEYLFFSNGMTSNICEYKNSDGFVCKNNDLMLKKSSNEETCSMYDVCRNGAYHSNMQHESNYDKSNCYMNYSLFSQENNSYKNSLSHSSAIKDKRNEKLDNSLNPSNIAIHYSNAISNNNADTSDEENNLFSSFRNNNNFASPDYLHLKEDCMNENKNLTAQSMTYVHNDGIISSNHYCHMKNKVKLNENNSIRCATSHSTNSNKSKTDNSVITCRNACKSQDDVLQIKNKFNVGINKSQHISLYNDNSALIHPITTRNCGEGSYNNNDKHIKFFFREEETEEAKKQAEQNEKQEKDQNCRKKETFSQNISLNIDSCNDTSSTSQILNTNFQTIKHCLSPFFSTDDIHVDKTEINLNIDDETLKKQVINTHNNYAIQDADYLWQKKKSLDILNHNCPMDYSFINHNSSYDSDSSINNFLKDNVNRNEKNYAYLNNFDANLSKISDEIFIKDFKIKESNSNRNTHNHDNDNNDNNNNENNYNNHYNESNDNNENNDYNESNNNNENNFYNDNNDNNDNNENNYNNKNNNNNNHRRKNLNAGENKLTLLEKSIHYNKCFYNDLNKSSSEDINNNYLLTKNNEVEKMIYCGSPIFSCSFSSSSLSVVPPPSYLQTSSTPINSCNSFFCPSSSVLSSRIPQNFPYFSFPKEPREPKNIPIEKRSEFKQNAADLFQNYALLRNNEGNLEENFETYYGGKSEEDLTEYNEVNTDPQRYFFNRKSPMFGVEEDE